MVEAQNIIDPFFRELNARLSQEINKRVLALADGSATATVNDTTSTAEKYAAHVSYLKAMNDVLDLCVQIDREKYGRKSADSEDRE